MAPRLTWHPSMYGVGPDFNYTAGNPVDPIGPDLKTQEEWWFRGPGYMALPPQDSAVMDLPAGGSVDIEIACHLAWTSYGTRTTDPNEELSACPNNYGAYHSGDPAGPIVGNLISGCALGIADVDDITDVTMDNLVIFSVQQKCVKQRVTTFEIPDQMPPCSGSKCVCSWMWLANNGTANFYMTAFDCSVSGSPSGAKAIGAPQDPVYCGDDKSKCTKGAKRPLYAYNTPTNVPGVDNSNRPGYHDTWSFSDGAQTDIFDGGGTPIASNSSKPSGTASDSKPSASTGSSSSSSGSGGGGSSGSSSGSSGGSSSSNGGTADTSSSSSEGTGMSPTVLTFIAAVVLILLIVFILVGHHVQQQKAKARAEAAAASSSESSGSSSDSGESEESSSSSSGSEDEEKGLGRGRGRRKKRPDG
ncbi:hypothetical protein JCM11641_005015 [Rhodosporidiobolus odoratus]